MKLFANPRLRSLGSLSLIIVAATVISAVRSTSAEAQVVAPNFASIIADEAYWMSLAQVPAGHGSASGAITVTNLPSNGHWLIRPYDANIGARGMLIGGSRYYPMVKNWMLWYFNHVNWPDYNGLTATVYDYNVDTTTYTETYATNLPAYDSTDSYAASFLTLARDYAQSTGDYAFLRQNKYLINAIGDSIQATKQTDGLTWAKPDYPAKYLMNNSEVFQGVSARAWLDGNVLGDPNGANCYTAQAQDVKNGVQNSLWQSAQNMYSPAIGGSGAPDVPKWQEWYPSSIGQAYPIHSQILSPTSTRAQQLWSGINTHWPNWTTTANNPTGTPGMTVCYIAAVMRDKTKTDTCLTGAVSNWTSKGRPWPWTVLESGMTTLAAQAGKTLTLG